MKTINMQDCLQIVSDFAHNPYDVKVEFGTLYFFLSEEDYRHLFEWQEYIRNVISPKYQLILNDFGMKSVVVTLTRNLL